MDKEDAETTPLILTFESQPEKDVRNKIRSLGLRWNKFRSEWYGTCDTKSLKEAVVTFGYKWTSPSMLLDESTSLNKERDEQSVKYIYVQNLKRE